MLLTSEQHTRIAIFYEQRRRTKSQTPQQHAEHTPTLAGFERWPE
jgi:hypothetical protein